MLTIAKDARKILTCLHSLLEENDGTLSVETDDSTMMGSTGLKISDYNRALCYINGKGYLTDNMPIVVESHEHVKRTFTFSSDGIDFIEGKI